MVQRYNYFVVRGCECKENVVTLHGLYIKIVFLFG